ncbi:MAG: T9SS type A sorting domain-containing protein, partial [Muribaculaceae bacterium]|nr:T9SS type A sorting domain-containing protein [Muribaculaceae bacterium]
VYTVSGNKAASINTTPEAEGVEIGLVACDDDVTVLRFDNVGCVDGYSLCDRTTGESYRLYEGMEYRVCGPVSGRLFLTAGKGVDDVDASAGIYIMSAGDIVKAVSPDSEAVIEMSVFDLAGKRIVSADGRQGVVETRMPAGGFYIVVAMDQDGRQARKKVMVQ